MMVKFFYFLFSVQAIGGERFTQIFIGCLGVFRTSAHMGKEGRAQLTELYPTGKDDESYASYIAISFYNT